jgi:hypothetical protein
MYSLNGFVTETVAHHLRREQGSPYHSLCDKCQDIVYTFLCQDIVYIAL